MSEYPKARRLAVLSLALSMLIMPVTGMANPAKCMQAVTKFYTKAMKLSGKAAGIACVNGGSDLAFDNALNSVAVNKVNKAFGKLAKRVIKLNCTSNDPDFVVNAGALNAAYLRDIYQMGTDTNLVELCDGISTPD